MSSAARNVLLTAALLLVGCGQAQSDGRLGFTGATATPSKMTMSPMGCAASYVFDNNLLVNLQGELIHQPPGTWPTQPMTPGPPRPGHVNAIGVFTAPSALAGKHVAVTVRGFIAGKGGTIRMSFAGHASETWTDAATDPNDPAPFIEHTFVAPIVAGENRFEIDVSLPLEGNDPAVSSFAIQTADFRVGDVQGCGPDIERYEREHPRAS